MSHRWTRGAPLLAAVLVATALAGTAAARVDAGGASKSVAVAFIYPKTGGLAAFGQEELDGFQAGLAYTSGKCGGYTINADLHRRRDRSGHRDQRLQERGRPGRQDRHGHRLVGDRAPARPSRRAEQRALHLRRGGGRRDHRAQPEHVPRGPADAAGRARRREHLPAEVDRKEDRRLRRGHRVRRRERRRRPGGLRRQGTDGVEDPLAVRRSRPDAVRAAAEELERRRGLRRLGEHDQLGGDVAVAAAAGRLEADDDSSPASRTGRATTRSARSSRA